MNYEGAEISQREEELATPSKDMKGVIIPENVASPSRTHCQKTPGPVTETTYSAVSRASESDCK